MSSKSWLLDVSNSMLIVDEKAFPVNLGVTVQEDRPEGSFRVLAYGGENVLPTALGYKSYFAGMDSLDIPNCPSQRVQQLFTYQTSSLYTILIALTEEGLYWVNATDTGDHTWNLVFPTGVPIGDTNRHLATHAVIGNKLCCYIQGQAGFLLVTDRASATNIQNQAALPEFVSGGVTVTRVTDSVEFGFAILRIVPSFLNMAGQLGLFRAGNRLGFWDSDNAVAWSSPTQLFDFTPSTETFAGITTFAAVQGRILKVLGHGDGFIIYASRSIVGVAPLSGSPERFTGSAILGEVGMAFDTQCCQGSPDTTHYVLSSSGLMEITSWKAKPIHTPISDYVVEHNSLVSIAFLDGRYLFLHTDKDMQPVDISVEGEMVTGTDIDGNEFAFQPAPGGSVLAYYQDFETTLDDGYTYGAWTGPSGPTTQPSYYSWRLTDPLIPEDPPAIEGSKSARRFINNTNRVAFGIEWGRYLIEQGYSPTAEHPLPVTIKMKARLHKRKTTAQADNDYLNFQHYPNPVSGPGNSDFFYTGHGPEILDLDETWEYNWDNPGIWGLMRLQFNYVYEALGSSPSSVLQVDELQILVGSGAPSPDTLLGNIISGASDPIREGLANFAPVPGSAGSIAYAQGSGLPLVPCFSGGLFSADWEGPLTTEVRAKRVLIDFGYGVSSFEDIPDVWFRTPFTTTQLGPRWVEATDFDATRVLDKAGHDMQEVITDVETSVTDMHAKAQVLLEAQATEEAFPIGTSTKHNAATGSYGPYPSERSDSTTPPFIIVTRNDLNTLIVKDVLTPGSTFLEATDCALRIKGFNTDWEIKTTISATARVKPLRVWDCSFPLSGAGRGNQQFGYAWKESTLEAAGVPRTAGYSSRALPNYAISGDGGTLSLGDVDSFTVEDILSRNITPDYAWSTFKTPEAMLAAMHKAKEELDASIYGDSVVVRAANNLLFAGTWRSEYKSNYGGTPPSELFNGGYRYALVSDTLSGVPLPYDPDAEIRSVISRSNETRTILYREFDITTGDPTGGVLDVIVPTASSCHWSTLVKTGPAPTSSDIGGLTEFLWLYETVGAAIGYEVFDIEQPWDDNPQYVDNSPYTGYGHFPYISTGKEEQWHAIQFAVTANAGSDWTVTWSNRSLLVSGPGPVNTEVSLLSAEVSGYGYFPNGANYSFRKTHTRHSSTTCEVPAPGTGVPLNPSEPVEFTYPPVEGGPATGNNQLVADTLPWPEPVPIPATSALFQRGSLGPYYPVYKGAVFWDVQLDKWGRLKQDHRALYSLMPINREDPGILPTPDSGLRAGSLAIGGKIKLWTGPNKVGRIKYGRIGTYRLGQTTVTLLSLRFAEPANCTVIIEPSIDGIDVDPALEMRADVVGAYAVEIPITLNVQWFNLTLDGSFNLVGLRYEGEARGRR